MASCAHSSDEVAVSFLDVLEAKLACDPSLLNELSVRRAFQQMRESLTIGILIVPPTNGEARSIGTVTRNRLRSVPRRFVRLLAHWSVAQSVLRTEAFVIQDISRVQLERFNAKGGRGPTVFCEPEVEGNLVLSHKGEDVLIGDFSPSRISQAIDRINVVQFLGFEYVAQTFMEAWAAQARLKGALPAKPATP